MDIDIYDIMIYIVGIVISLCGVASVTAVICFIIKLFFF